MRLIACSIALAIAAVGATPAAAADKLVPGNATGALEAHRGKPWTEPLFTCAGFSIYNARRLKAAGDMDTSWTVIGRGLDFKNAGAAQFARDKGVSAEAATARATKSSENYAIAVEMQDLDDTGFREWTKACDEIWAGWKKAGG